MEVLGTSKGDPLRFDTEMQRRRMHWIAAGALAAAVAAAGGAYAAGKLDSPKARSDAIIADAAGQLNIPASKLSAALQKAIDDQIDAAVAAGRLTKEEGDALKQRVDSGDVPLVGGFGFGPGPGHGLGHPGHGLFGEGLEAAAGYLGITTDELRSELRSGKTLAQIATAHGKTADGLVAALVAAAKQRLDQAVAAGRITSSQEQTMLSRLQSLLQAVVNGTPPQGGFFGGPRDGPHGFGFGFGPRRHGDGRL